MTLLFAALGSVTARVWWVGMRTVRSDWNLASTYVVVIAGLSELPSAIGQLLGGAGVYIDTFGHTTYLVDPRVFSLQRVATPVYIVLGLATLLHGITRRRPLAVPLLLVVVVVFTTAAATALNGGALISIRSVALACILIGALTLPRGAGAVLGLACVGLSTVVLSCLILVFQYQGAVIDCRTDKCGVLGVLVNGIYSSENVLGLVTASTLPAIFLAFRGGARSWLFLSTIGFVVLTGSRSSTEAAVVVLVGAVIYGFNAATLKIYAFGVVAVAVLLPFLTKNPSAFTGRGELWLLAREGVKGSKFIGLGGDSWSGLLSVGKIHLASQYGPHNQWLDVLYTSGLLGVLLLVGAVVISVRGAGRDNAGRALFLFLACFALGILERPWTVTSIDAFAWILPATLLAVPHVVAVRTRAPETERRANRPVLSVGVRP